ncbi:sigma-54-dependent transcriptional regulator [Thiothrix nivea]|uniref:Two component, sigma54 specific, transcriptional regulator, Fis family n=1 Tax=Thiothrix nivea (strain ATCC 35100 / DSM 5205 / JP2) TaxID=870187 RepID=A0A656HC40_THINJ|nr:sigma-54 dependent transcriptional regulator [Thiothrix nivea]EIJ33030.1 two component, sigma54 specific, transcriptional regulator, Fis family [Thiothrix nivea DSM 5205]
MSDTILIIEDERLLGSELQLHYRKQGYEAIWAENCFDARRKLKSRSIDPLVVLSDLNLPDGNGLDLLEENPASLNGCEWVFLTGYGDVPDSVRALQLGAFDFLTKPCPQEQLDMTVHSAMRSAQAQRRLLAGANDASQRYTVDSFIGGSPVTEQTRQMLQQLSQVPYSALILTGATGTGKGLAARILHYNSTRAKEPLVELNCAALPKDLMESELFGHEAGSFTGAKGRHRGLIEQVDGGTLFLDEIGEMPLDLQAKLLKVLEDRKVRRLGGERELSVDIQIIAATNRNLQSEISAGNFRADLYHRLSVFELRLPALKERATDLRELIPTLLAEFNAKTGKKVSQLSPRVWNMLERYPWPGNVRELRNVLERCVMLSTSSLLPEQWLQLQAAPLPENAENSPTTPATLPTVPAGMPAPPDNGGDSGNICFPLDGSMGLDDMVGNIISQMLVMHDGNVTEVARVLNTTREKIRYRIEKFQLR